MKAIIIGAGQTGRGLIAPILKNSGYDIVFIDKNQELIENLKNNSKYLVKYFGNVKSPVEISDYKAFTIDSIEALNAIKEADLVTTSVFANQIESLIPYLYKAIENRTNSDKLNIITIENGVDVKRPLINANLDANISEGIIFCTSIRDNESLDITSEADIEIPINGDYLPKNLNIVGMPKITKFSELIQRKIYTYNFISAIISYLGDYENYQNYSEAATNKVIREFIDSILPNINYIIAKNFDISVEEQEQFSKRAVLKFVNKDIFDSIERNAQQARRKLGPNERLLIPLKLALKFKTNYFPYLIVIAAAMHYATKHENANLNDMLKDIRTVLSSNIIIDELEAINLQFNIGIELNRIIKFWENKYETIN